MKKVIITTTIYPIRKAIIEYSKMIGWDLVIVGDKKTPEAEYWTFADLNENCTFLGADEQEKRYKKISDAIGWNSIQRRNIGFLHAYQMGYEIFATVDDDNIPLDNWGKEIYLNTATFVDVYDVEAIAFDPLAPFHNKEIWHRGFPLELLESRFEFKLSKKSMTPMVQANLWNGDPDVDAMSRISFKPTVEFPKLSKPYSSLKLLPFNSQNTILSRDAIPFYFVLPFIGRFDDIWASYIFQHYFPEKIIFSDATVFQDRNEQNLVANLENEIFGYYNTFKLLHDLKNYHNYLPQRSLIALKEYRTFFDEWK